LHVSGPGTAARAAAIRRSSRALLLAVIACAPTASSAADEGTPAPAAEPVRTAEIVPLAAKGLLIALAAAGERLVAVGDRGIIVMSDDQGGSWAQAEYVPTQGLLTGVCFLDPQHGVAVGHDEVILTTADAGRTWKRTHYAPQALRPLLDVWCGADGRVIAVGAYSAYFTSADGGASWSEVKFTPLASTTAAPKQVEVGGGFHLNRIVAAGATRLYIAGEAGHLYRSDDGGGSWRTLASPYEGSFFGVLPLSGEALLAFGLRGHLYRSGDGGATWQPIDTGTVALLGGAAALDNGAVAVVGFSGVVLVSRDGGRSFSLQQQADRTGLSAVVAAGDDRLAVVGEDGARLIRVARTAAVSGGASP
jgi:photosystem II stability/assembly factor-like uncharacterized protein